MIKKFFIIFLVCVSVYAKNYSLQEFKWPSGITLLDFLESSNIPLSLYYNLEAEEKELVTEIIADSDCDMLIDETGKVDQILVPISDELQIHIYKDKENKFKLTFTPIIYEEKTHSLGINIEKSPYLDISKATGSSALSNAFMVVFGKVVNFRKLQKGDALVLHYTQKYRLGKPYGNPRIISGMMEENKKSYYMYYYDSKYYDEKGKMAEKFLFRLPVPGARVSSKFSPKRYHPVLKRYRAHLGTDYAAPKGTPIKAVADGKVVFVGKKGGYGNTIEISHINGYKSLYAHTSKFAKGMKVGRNVSQGQIIAYIGTTGLSTGPHLHLGLYKNNRAIDFEKVVYVEKDGEFVKEKAKFEKFKRVENEKLQNAMGGYQNPPKIVTFDNFIKI
ncbi:zinc metallopeptidase, M23 family [Campylobacter blaseri]|uniref:Endopeptidase n=1 Tax=Campylobacter blaseri TaxID=2042961 RepID=A0A2P8QZV2_9BACT|nr:peptidoglycan DD-metalloendopeptidase family protein [Campylobacter blaseri]PSM51768.1 endopeptidase [Campylobacter blaseri]PSM53559.1 endopeptidase [Campylobacter blaseri]QKF86368.1 zinc metallopeptidase, M23 family [Campylobacter blaseri]